MGAARIWVSVSATALVALLVACGSGTMTHHTGACTGTSPPAGCGMSCAGGTPCPAGTYCSIGAMCTADCSPTTPCRTGSGACQADGHCGTGPLDAGTGSDGGPPPDFGPNPDFGTFDNTCASVMLTTARVTPNVILLVDRSGSMSSMFDMGLSRWQTLYNALMASPTGLVYTLQDAARFGLVLFTGQTVPFFGGVCPDLATVLPAALHNYDAINAVYSPASPGTNTPTGASLDATVAAITSMPLAAGPTIIVLCTDGEPNTCADSGDTTGGQAAAISAAANALASGYTVDAIGVASGVSLANLTMVASAGGGSAVSVTDTASLVSALTSIVGGAVSCSLELSGMIDPTMACAGDVELNGMPLPCGDPNGWDAVDMSHIELRGTACDTLLHMTGSTVNATFPCGVLLH